ncbi:MAG: FMN-binding protein [Lachnospiraceae bacterium]
MAKTKKQSMIKDALILCAISLIAALVLGFVNEMTKDRIALLAAQEKAAAYQAIFPAAVGIVDKSDNEILATAMEEAGQILSSGGFTNVTLDEVCIVWDGNGDTIGYVASVTLKGFDMMTLTFGYTTDGVCTGLEFLSINETPGMGLKANEPAFKNQFVNKNADSFQVVKGGAASDNEIDCITGATITSEAVVKGINAGICFMNELQTRLGGAK